MSLPHGVSGLVPDEYVARTWIAGGFAACPELATDIDLWVLAGYERLLEQVRQELVDYLNEGFAYEEEAGIDIEDYEGIAITILKVAVIPYHPLNVHLMVTDAPIIDAVLANFDISTHQVAISPDGQIVHGKHWTHLNVPPVVLIDTDRIPAPLEKIINRYAQFRSAAIA